VKEELLQCFNGVDYLLNENGECKDTEMVLEGTELRKSPALD
jgi:hypothetical protein